MKAPLFVRTLTSAEVTALRAALRSSEAFTVRRAQILLDSHLGKPVRQIAQELHCTRPTVCHAIQAFRTAGLACLQEKSSRPHSAKPLLDESFHEPLRELLHSSPRTLGKPTSCWTLDLVAEVVHDKGWTPRRLTKETIRVAVQRLQIGWKRAKQWITSPDPAYARKKKPVTA